MGQVQVRAKRGWSKEPFDIVVKMHPTYDDWEIVVFREHPRGVVPIAVYKERFDTESEAQDKYVCLAESFELDENSLDESDFRLIDVEEYNVIH